VQEEVVQRPDQASSSAGESSPSRADFAAGVEALDGGDYVAAAEAWRPLAEAGDSLAQVALAGLYIDGLGVPRSMTEALRWYRAAADQGHPVAQLNLGDIYSSGRRVPRDLAQGYAWLSLAAEQGRQWAENKRQQIRRLMSEEELSQAEALIETLRPPQ